MRRGTPVRAHEEDTGAAGEEPRTGEEPCAGEESRAEERNRTGEEAVAAEGDSAEDAPPVRTWWARRRAVVVAVVSVLLLLAGCVLLQRAHALRHTSGAADHALTDAEASDRVAGDVGSALARVFSYTPDGTAGTERSAKAVLAGKAARQYEALLGKVRDDVRTQRVTLSTQSVRVGVVSLRGNTAHLLVFLDQTARRGDAKPTTSAAQLSVTAHLGDGVWRVVDLTAR
ncbi:hypothetical protein [Streptomyces sp. SID11385]|uniref:hypothetical protein n=1 Tax=Streptomyces sp. SID11385 TaxID=2706031 RepID=UPI0013C59C7C|nr:hypothetical protein [Streptomyces sp. SID11385]NEA44641.1 hypothetical protein [Streptomyces sp. SID11385]